MSLFFPIQRAFQTQALSVAYGASLTIPQGSRAATVTLDDAAIGFTVQDQAAGTPAEAIPAGSSWGLGNDLPLALAVTIQVKSASGTPGALLAYFLPPTIA